MVSGARGWKSLHLFFTKHGSVLLVYFWVFHFRGLGLGLYGEVSGNASVGALFLQLGDNCSSFLLIFLWLHWPDTLARYGEVLQVKGAFFPLEARFKGSQPRIPQYETFSPDVRDQEPHLLLFLVSGYTEIDVSGNTSCFVLCVIDIEQLPWFVQQGHPQA